MSISCTKKGGGKGVHEVVRVIYKIMVSLGRCKEGSDGRKEWKDGGCIASGVGVFLSEEIST